MPRSLMPVLSTSRIAHQHLRRGEVGARKSKFGRVLNGNHNPDATEDVEREGLDVHEHGEEGNAALAALLSQELEAMAVRISWRQDVPEMWRR
jgi:hypothetical protein